MDHRFKLAATKLEQIKKKHVKQIPSDAEDNFAALISDLKLGVKKQKDVERKFDALERAFKTKKPDLWKMLEDIRNSLEADSMSITGASNASVLPEQKIRADSEMAFMVECFRVIVEILQDNGDTKILPKPEESLTEKVSEGYSYASKVASLCKEQKSHLDRASKIIDDLYDQAVEGNDDPREGKSEKPPTPSSKKGSINKGKTVPKKPDPGMASGMEVKGTAVSSALKNAKGDLKRASKIIEDLYTQAVKVNDDQVRRKTEKPTAASSKKGSENKRQTAPSKTELDMASDLEAKGTAVTLALTKTKGDLGRASKIIEDLYNEAVECTDDQAQQKQETSSSKKGNKDKGQTVPTNPEPDIASALETKGKAVLSALKNTKGDLECASKIIENLFNQSVEDKHDQVKGNTENPTATGSKQGSSNKGQSVPKKPEHDKASVIETKGAAVSLALKNMKGDLDLALKGMSQLMSLIKVDETETAQNVHTNRPQGQQHTATGRKQRSGPAPEVSVRGSTQLNEDFQTVLSAFSEMKKKLTEMKEIERTAKQTSDLLEDLYQQSVPFTKNQMEENTKHVTSPSKRTDKSDAVGHTKNGTQSKAQSDDSSEHGRKCRVVSAALKQLEKLKSEAEHASELLDKLYKYATSLNGDQVKEQTDTPERKKISKRKNADEDTQDHMKSEKDKVSKHDEIFESVSLTLMKMEEANSEVRRLKYEIESLEDMLSELKKYVSDGGRKPIALNVSNEMKRESQAYESSRQIFQMFKEKERQIEEMNGKNKYLEDLINALGENLSGGEHKHGHSSETSVTHGNDLRGDERAMKILTDFKNMERQVEKVNNENDFLVGLLNALYDSVAEGEDKLSKKQSSTSPGNETSGYDKASKILRMFQEKKNEIETASQRLEELSIVSYEVGSGDATTEQLTNTTANFDISTLKTRDRGITESRQVKVSLDETINKVGKLLKKTYREINTLKRKVSEAGKDLENAKVAQEEILQQENSLRTRLSELASAKLVHNNPNISDLSDPNRPTKLQEQYSELYDNVWTDSFDKLSHAGPQQTDKEITNILLEMFKEGFEFCRHRRQIQIRSLFGIIFHPDRDIASSQVEEADIGKNEVLEKHLTDSVKYGSDKAGENIAEAFYRLEDMQKKFGNHIQMNKTYVKKCVKLCWLMQVHTPPVCIDLTAKPGDKFDKDTYKEYTKKGSKIDFIVWPPLRLHEGGPLLAKGVAQGKEGN